MRFLEVRMMNRQRLDEIKQLKDKQKKKSKDKPFKNLSNKEKDELLETICRMLDLI